MFGSDLPSTRAPRAFEVADIQMLIEVLGETAAEMAFWNNAQQFYGFGA